jgi:hypothetical protein
MSYLEVMEGVGGFLLVLAAVACFAPVVFLVAEMLDEGKINARETLMVVGFVVAMFWLGSTGFWAMSRVVG